MASVKEFFSIRTRILFEHPIRTRILFVTRILTQDLTKGFQTRIVDGRVKPVKACNEDTRLFVGFLFLHLRSTTLLVFSNPHPLTRLRANLP